MLATASWSRFLKAKVLGFWAIALSICFTVVACAGGGGSQAGGGGIAPEVVVDYIHTVLLADRTAYTKHVVNRLTKLEGREKADGVVPAEATEAWQQANGIPLPAQMFRLGAEIAVENGDFTYGLISPWNINDNQAPKTEFEQMAMDKVIETGEPYKDYQEIGGQRYFSGLYPDNAVAEACVTCHNEHPIHKERYPDKVFQMGDVMGGVMINLPISDS